MVRSSYVHTYMCVCICLAEFCSRRFYKSESLIFQPHRTKLGPLCSWLCENALLDGFLHRAPIETWYALHPPHIHEKATESNNLEIRRINNYRFKVGIQRCTCYKKNICVLFLLHWIYTTSKRFFLLAFWIWQFQYTHEESAAYSDQTPPWKGSY